MHAGRWTMLGYGTTQILRLAGNLVLTRLLFPEAFGLMALVMAVVTGVTMLSDVGIEQSIVHNKRGHEPAFVNTAWTIQVIRGLLISIALWLLAVPIASFYGEPMLSQLLPVVGLTSVIGGLRSTKMASADRDLVIARTTVITVGSYALGLTVTVIWAWLDRSIWSLVIGSIVGAVALTVASHALLGGIRNRFFLERESLRGLLTFGSWIFVSSALTFLVGEGNRLLIGGMLDVKMLAFFALAMTMDRLLLEVVQQISGKVLFPAYSEVVRERPERLYAVVLKSRLIQIVPYWFAGVFFVYFGDSLMSILYDERYKDSGWMLQMLAMGSLIRCVIVSYNGILWAKGMVRISTALVAVQLFLQIMAMIVGYHFGGAKGMILGLAAGQWLLYPAYAFVFSRISLWQPKIDFPFIGMSFLIALTMLGRFF